MSDLHEYDEKPKGAIWWDSVKQDDRPKLGWWAPGGYIGRCRACNAHFLGAKRAGHCADCAYSNEFLDYQI